MTDRTIEPHGARALPGQRAMNVLMRGVLAAPGLAHLAGKRLLVLYVIGRKSGKEYRIPVAYEREGGELLIGTSARWARNLRTGDIVTMRFLGKLVKMRVSMDVTERAATADYALIASKNPAFAKFNRLTVTDGVVSADDLRAAWAAGARGIRLAPLR
ncbi:nitroreductase/quinone reductase family protein [Gryllotalpicola koreensis]